MARHESRARERGVALVMTMLVLLVVTMIATAMMASLNVETRIASFSVQEAKARNLAESGVGEAISRIRNGDIAYDGNPRKVWQIFLQAPGSVPVLGTDSTGFATAQPSGTWLKYTSAGRGPEALTVKLKTNNARTVIYRYDASQMPPVNTTSGSPIYVVTSSGRDGATIRRVETEVFVNPFQLTLTGSVSCNVDLKLTGNSAICGYNHDPNTPVDTGSSGRGSSPDCVPYETGSGNIPGVCYGGSLHDGGGSQQDGVPPVLPTTSFYAGPWEVFNMTQSEYFSWIGSPQAAAPTTLDGVVHLDNDAVSQNGSGGWGLHGVGEGFLYADGDVTMNAGFTYRGIIYVEGDCTVNGHAWILGALIIKGKVSSKLDGGMTLLYSNDGIQQALLRSAGRFVTTSWREVP